MTDSNPPSCALRLLDEVSWNGRAISGTRPQSLIAALAAASAPVPAEQLVEQVWQSERPANPAKAVQVLVSRVRGIDRDLVRSVSGGYRLGVPADQVDASELTRLVAAAEHALAGGDASAAGEYAESALAFRITEGGPPPVAGLRASAQDAHRDAVRIRGLALVRTGEHAAAEPHLRAALRDSADDVDVRGAALRVTAAVHGTPAALAEYDAYRVSLADRLGADPDPQLQRLHRELLAADAPVRTGLRYDADPLLGRDGDIARLRAAMNSGGRLVTVTGPGGIGKTRVAQLIAREATQPRVHVVELVGVGTGDDVVAAIGAALGIRDTVGDRVLNAAQRSSLRGRIAQHLDDGPTFVVLDNCEHVLEQVSALVAFLLVTCRDLTILVTSRAPLRIAAERVVPLSQLDEDDAAALFRRRALAVRPDAVLEHEVVREIVGRLDGLPLAVELAAARVRTMTAAEVRTALADRLAALRTRDRVAPARHRTLEAVIGWSWDLLEPREQQALAWMSLFHDGFDRDTAAAMLGADGPDVVDSLLEQSLLVHTEDDGHSRFRALETIREYAARKLDQLPVDSGRAAAEAAQNRWASDLATGGADLFLDADQLRIVDQLTREQNNLTDVLRRALATPDPGLAAHLLATMGSVWMITGEHPRVFAMITSAAPVFVAHQPTSDERRSYLDALGLLILHRTWVSSVLDDGLLEAFRQAGDGPGTLWADVCRAMFVDPHDTRPVDVLVERAGASTDSTVRAAYLLWAAIIVENDGELDASERYAREALEGASLTPYLEAALLGQLAQVLASVGKYAEAAPYAAQAAPLMERLHAGEDARMMWLFVAIHHVIAGEYDAAERLIEQVDATTQRGQPGSLTFVDITRAELELARGEVAEGQSRYLRAVAAVTSVRLPDIDLSPWLVLAGAGAMAACVRWPASADVDRARELRDELSTRFDLDHPVFRDRPLLATTLLGVALWYLRWGDDDELDAALRIIAVAHLWNYNQGMPVTSWGAIVGIADERRPGVLTELVAELASRPVDGLFDVLRVQLSALATSSG